MIQEKYKNMKEKIYRAYLEDFEEKVMLKSWFSLELRDKVLDEVFNKAPRDDGLIKQTFKEKNKELKSKINYIFGLILMLSILLFFPDYYLPIPQEYIRESIGQIIVFYTGVGIILNEFLRENKKESGK